MRRMRNNNLEIKIALAPLVALFSISFGTYNRIPANPCEMELRIPRNS